MQLTYDWIWRPVHSVKPPADEPPADVLTALFADGLASLVFSHSQSGWTAKQAPQCDVAPQLENHRLRERGTACHAADAQGDCEA